MLRRHQRKDQTDTVKVCQREYQKDQNIEVKESNYGKKKKQKHYFECSTSKD